MSRYQPGSNHLVINWGSSYLPDWWVRHQGQTLNHPRTVALACNKYSTLYKLSLNQEVSVPEWTSDEEVATSWVNDGHKVFCRTLLTSHSGNGIVIATTAEEIVPAPLYVQAIKKDIEYRVHVFHGEILDYQQKKKKHDFVGGIPGIRNHTNGWIYARADLDLPTNVKEESIKAVAALGLDFGAVDVCIATNGEVYVFEVNTAPGLTGTTLQKYVDKIKEICHASI